MNGEQYFYRYFYMWYLDRATNRYHRDAQRDAILQNFCPSKIWEYHKYKLSVLPYFRPHFRSASGGFYLCGFRQSQTKIKWNSSSRLLSVSWTRQVTKVDSRCLLRIRFVEHDLEQKFALLSPKTRFKLCANIIAKTIIHLL